MKVRKQDQKFTRCDLHESQRIWGKIRLLEFKPLIKLNSRDRRTEIKPTADTVWIYELNDHYLVHAKFNFS